MSEKEYKEKCNNLFARNSILLHRIDELELQLKVAGKRIDTLSSTNIELSNQIEKMKNIIYEKVDFCSYCPHEDCKNDEGTCPYEYLPEEEQKKILAEWITKNGS